MSVPIQNLAPEALPDSVFIFGCGYIGTALAQRLIAQGVRVGALTRNAESAHRLRSLGLAEVVEGNLHDADLASRIELEYEGVVNCVSSAGGGIDGYRLSYLEGQKRILEWVRRQEVAPVYIYTSSTSVYPQDGGEVVTEVSCTQGAPETGRVLLESESLIADAESSLRRWYVLRLAGIYGPGRHYLIDQVRDGAGRIPGRGDYTLNMIHRDDAVDAILSALTGLSDSGIYNICDDSPAHKEVVVKWLAELLDLPEPVFDPDLVSPRLKRRGGRMPDRRIDNGKARRELDWSPQFTSFDQGYRHVLGEMNCDHILT